MKYHKIKYNQIKFFLSKSILMDNKKYDEIIDEYVMRWHVVVNILNQKSILRSN